MVDPTNHPARDEWERMLSGELYVADSPQQQEANMRKRRLVQAINTSEYDAFKERDELFHELFGAFGEGGFVEPPFNCDYGCNTFIGKNHHRRPRVLRPPSGPVHAVSSDRCDGAFLRP